MKKIILLLLFFFLAGCASIDYKSGPVAGLDRMIVEEHFIDGAKIYDVCTRCGHIGLEIPLACTCINFRTNRAVIWLAKGAPESVIEHERAHGRGYDHVGGDLRERYASWKMRTDNLARESAPLRRVSEAKVD